MFTKPFFELTEILIKKYCNNIKTFTRGEEYIDSVSDLRLMDDKLFVKVYGNDIHPYRVTIIFKKKEWKNGYCTCPAEIRPCN